MASRCSDAFASPEGLDYDCRFRRPDVVQAFRPAQGRTSLRAWSAIAALLMMVAAAAQTPPPLETATQRAAERAAERLKALQREADGLASQEKTLLVELRKLEVDRQIKTEELKTIEQDLEQTHAQLEETMKRAASLRDVAEMQRPEIEARLVQVYKMGRAGYWRLLLDVEDVRSIGRAYRTASAMTRIDRERVQQHQRTLEALAKERSTLEARARDIGALQEKAAAARAGLDRAVAARTALVASIDARRDLNAQLTGELQAAQQRLQASLSQLAAGRPVPAVTLPIRPFKGTLPWPATGVVVSRFAPEPGRGAAARNGIEISMGEGRPVRAIHDGTVAYAEPFTGYGNLVIVDHGDNAYSLYGHLDTLEVKRGDRVDPQGRLGTSGRNPSGNPALYFELRIDAKPVDPLQWLRNAM